MKINKLTISNFAGIKEESFNFDGKDTKYTAIMRLARLQQQPHYNGCFSIKVWTDQPNHLTPVPLNEKRRKL